MISKAKGLLFFIAVLLVTTALTLLNLTWIAALALILAIAATALVRLFKEKQDFTAINSNEGDRYAYIKIISSILITRIGLYLFAYVIARMSGITQLGFFGSFDRIWLHSGTDAASYVGIAENWYVTTGDPMYHIVFFPFYPIVIKLFQLVVGDYFAASMLASTFASCGSGIVAYKLALLDFDKETALRFVKYIFILPAAFFYLAPMTESLFLLLCLCCIYFTRKKKYALMALFGILAAFTRSAGVLLGLPCALITLFQSIEERKSGENKKPLAVTLIKPWLWVGSILLGLFAYLFINYTVHGNPFQFMIYQKEHWSQGLGFFSETIKTIQWQYNDYLSRINWQSPFLTNWDFKCAYALWLAELLYIPAALIVVFFSSKKLNSAYVLFFVAYFVFSIGATWLLSAPRYLMACFVLPLGLAVLTKKRWVDFTATTLCIILGLGYLGFYAIGSPIY